MVAYLITLTVLLTGATVGKIVPLQQFPADSTAVAADTAQQTAEQVTDFSGQQRVEDLLRSRPQPEAFRGHLYELTRHPHRAGTARNREVRDYITEVSRQAGLEVAHYDYDVWLAEPGEVRVSIVSPDTLHLPLTERVVGIDPDTGHPELPHGWNAYSGSGEVTAEVVYANYGRREDFALLAEMGIDVRGKIVLARYGGNFRGFKAKYAEAAGASGLIIYTDPANGGYVNGPVYPDGIYSSASAIQRGSLLTLNYFGDPLTPFEAALPVETDSTVRRLHPDDVDFHTIPVTPIGYGAAEYIFTRMLGERLAPESWRGGFPFPYRLTGGRDLLVHLSVNQPQGLKPITNVVATVQGSEFPDEWIILGSHYDAWGFGTTDPNSGTAMLLTLTETLGEMVRAGYAPRRSIKIAHWDAEEYLMIGSTEWVEQLREELGAKAVAYINADMSVTGSRFGASASPSLKQAVIDASKAVMHPDTGGSLYESWHQNPDTAEPPIGNLGGGSDHVPLYMHAGIPSTSVGLYGSVPIYHTNYDTFWFYETHLDSTFRYGPALTAYYGILSTRLANAPIIPYDLGRYGSDLHHHLNTLNIRARELDRQTVPDDLFILADTLALLGRQAETELRQRTETLSPENIVCINRELIQLERTFLDEQGMPFGGWFRSVYASINPFDGYANWMLPGLRYTLEESGTREEFDTQAEVLRQAMLRLKNHLEKLPSGC